MFTYIATADGCLNPPHGYIRKGAVVTSAVDIKASWLEETTDIPAATPAPSGRVVETGERNVRLDGPPSAQKSKPYHPLKNSNKGA